METKIDLAKGSEDDNNADNTTKHDEANFNFSGEGVVMVTVNGKFYEVFKNFRNGEDGIDFTFLVRETSQNDKYKPLTSTQHRHLIHGVLVTYEDAHSWLPIPKNQLYYGGRELPVTTYIYNKDQVNEEEDKDAEGKDEEATDEEAKDEEAEEGNEDNENYYFIPSKVEAKYPNEKLRGVWVFVKDKGYFKVIT